MTHADACALCQVPEYPPRFTGKERDSESGNDYFGARYYASTMGRFLSPDFSEDPSPVPFAERDNPQTLNLYSYAENNPFRWVDPDGHSTVKCSDKTSSTQDSNGNIHLTVREECTVSASPGDNWEQRSIIPLINWSQRHPYLSGMLGGTTPDCHGCIQYGIMPWGMTEGLAGEIPWSSAKLAAAAKALKDGATSITVDTKAEAEELFLRLYQGDGYRNTTGMGPTEVKDMFGEKAGTYHWDTAGEGHGPSNPHGGSDHLQIHTHEGPIIRIFFNSK
jgi:RHS repeat-associated protein